MDENTNKLELTNPATELVALAEIIRKFKSGPTRPTVHLVLAHGIGVDPNSFEFLELVASVGRRVHALEEFSRNVKDNSFSPRMRARIDSSTARFGALFRPASMAQDWDALREKTLSDDVITGLETFAIIAQRHRPLRLINSLQVEELKKKIDELIADAIASDIPFWAKQAVLLGLQRLAVTLHYFPFFGIEMLAAEVLSLHARTQEIQRSVVAADPDRAAVGYKTLFRILEVIAVVGHLVCLPADAQHAYQVYRGWVAGPSTVHLPPPSEQKLLPPPDSLSIETEGV
jgi:hypothetical protein